VPESVSVAAYSESAPYFFAIEGPLAAADTELATSIAIAISRQMLMPKTNLQSERTPRAIRGDTTSFNSDEK